MMSIFALAFLTLGNAGLPWARPQMIDSRARSIVALMESTYGGMRTYADTGFSSTVFARTGEITGHRETAFRTLLARPASVRFEFSTPFRNGKAILALWGDGKQKVIDRGKAFVVSEFDGRDGSIQRDVPFDLGVAAMTGMSEGVAHFVPRMFFPTIGGRTFSDIKDLRLVREESLALGECYVLKSASEGTTIWVEKSHHALLKMVVSEDLGAIGGANAHVISTQTITYKPQFNPSLKTKDFWFSPPQGAHVRAGP